MRGSMARIHLLIDELPQYLPFDTPELGPQHHGHQMLGASIENYEKAWEAQRLGKFPDEWVIEAVIQSATDSTLTKPGQHTMTLGVQQLPYELDGTDWDAEKERWADSVLEDLFVFAPNLREHILDRYVITPKDIERDYSITAGNIFHGAMGLDQLFASRPLSEIGSYATPIAGYYLCGAGTHPGGGVMGANGHNAAKVDPRNRRRRATTPGPQRRRPGRQGDVDQGRQKSGLRARPPAGPAADREAGGRPHRQRADEPPAPRRVSASARHPLRRAGSRWSPAPPPGSAPPRRAALAAAGAAVALLARRREPLEALAAELGEDAALALVADVADSATVAAAVAATVARFGRLDAVVNSAGVSIPAVARRHRRRHLARAHRRQPQRQLLRRPRGGAAHGGGRVDRQRRLRALPDRDGDVRRLLRLEGRRDRADQGAGRRAGAPASASTPSARARSTRRCWPPSSSSSAPRR